MLPGIYGNMLLHMVCGSEHLPGKDNTLADRESRIFHDNTEWMLNPTVFDKCVQLVFRPNIDLFASRLNAQLDAYISWKPDPGAVITDAFSVSWSSYKFYALPPFSLLDKVIQRILTDRAEGLLIAPYWPTQHWYPKLMKMCVSCPRRIPPAKNLLTLPYAPDTIHPLHRRLQLLACHVSGNIMSDKVFPMRQFPLL